jgi:hypothetical protein
MPLDALFASEFSGSGASILRVVEAEAANFVQTVLPRTLDAPTDIKTQ